MRGDTESDGSPSEDDRFAHVWEEIVESLPEMAELDVKAAKEEAHRSRPNQHSRRFRKSRRVDSPSEPFGAETPELSTPDQIRAANEPPPGPRDWIEDEEEEDGFTPPELPPMKPRGFVITALWATLCMAPALLVAFLIFWPNAPRAITIALIIAFFGSAGLLIARRPRDRTDADPGDGVAL